jgi:hypothetical protein
VISEQGQKIEFDLAVFEVVEHLIGGTVSAAFDSEQFFHVVDIEVRHAPAFDFSSGAELLERFHGLTERHVSAPVQEVKIDCINAKPFQTALTCLRQFAPRCVVRIHFRDDKHALALTFDCVGDDLFRVAVAVHLRGVD